MSAATSAAIGVGLLMRVCPDPERPFGVRTEWAAALMRAGAPLGVDVIGFDPRDLDLAEGQVLAWRLDPYGRWQRLSALIPPVVYCRYTQPDLPRWQRLLAAHGVRFLNSGSLNKWQAHTLLGTHPALAPHLPATRRLEQSADLTTMLAQHDTLFLKPIAGSLGRGIMRCGQAPGGEGCDGAAWVEFVSPRTGALRRVQREPQRLTEWVQSQGAYLVQQALDLQVFAGRAADVRQLWQKDGTGCWQLTGQGARVAAPDRFTANLQTGGTAMPVAQLMGAICGDDAPRQQAIAATMEDFAHTLFSCLEAHLGPLGEIGLDLGIDRAGQVWYLEHNAQPGQRIIGAVAPEQVPLALQRPLRYARYLVERGTQH